MSDHVVSPATAPPRVTISSPKSHGSLDADIIIKNAPDPVFVSDLEGKILSANDAVYELLGFRTDEVLEQSLSRFISPEETREFTAALREVIERGEVLTRSAVAWRLRRRRPEDCLRLHCHGMGGACTAPRRLAHHKLTPSATHSIVADAHLIRF